MKTVTVVLALLLAGCASTPLPEKYRRKNPNPITIELRQRTICQEERDGRTIVYTCEVPE